MKDAVSVAHLVETICDQIETFLIAGPSRDENEAHCRMAFANQVERYLREWAEAAPCPIEYKILYDRWAALKEGHLALVVITRRDFMRLQINPTCVTGLSAYKPEILLSFDREMANAVPTDEPGFKRLRPSQLLQSARPRIP